MAHCVNSEIFKVAVKFSIDTIRLNKDRSHFKVCYRFYQFCLGDSYCINNLEISEHEKTGYVFIFLP